MNTEYIRLAYERTVVADCRRNLMSKYIDGGGTAKETLICESVPYEMREVPDEVFVEMIQRLEAEEKRLTDEMAKYEFRKRDERPQLFAPKPDPEQPAAEQSVDDAGEPEGNAGNAGDAEQPPEPAEPAGEQPTVDATKPATEPKPGRTSRKPRGQHEGDSRGQ